MVRVYNLLGFLTVLTCLYVGIKFYQYRFQVSYLPFDLEVRGQSGAWKAPDKNHGNSLNNEDMSGRKRVEGNWVRQSKCTQADVDRHRGVIVLTTTNAAFIDFTDNWLESIRRTQTCPRIQIIAEDEETANYYADKATQNPGLTVVQTWFGEKTSKQLNFGSTDFNRFMNKRAQYIKKLVQDGYEVLFTDVDTFWIRNPFPYFQEDFDFAVERDLPQFYCAGFVYFKPTPNTKAFLQAWIDFMAKDKKGYPDQKVMNLLIKKRKIPELKLKILDTDNFPNGKKFFDEKWRENKTEIVVVHNNWIVGHDAKKRRFIACGMWLKNGTTNTCV